MPDCDIYRLIVSYLLWTKDDEATPMDFTDWSDFDHGGCLPVRTARKARLLQHVRLWVRSAFRDLCSFAAFRHRAGNHWLSSGQTAAASSPDESQMGTLLGRQHHLACPVSYNYREYPRLDSHVSSSYVRWLRGGLHTVVQVDRTR